MIGILSMDPNNAITAVEKVTTSNSVLKWYIHYTFLLFQNIHFTGEFPNLYLEW